MERWTNEKSMQTCTSVFRFTDTDIDIHTSKKYFVVHLNRKIVKEKCLQWQREYNCNILTMMTISPFMHTASFSLALLSFSENKWTSAQWWLCLSAYERVSFWIPSACPSSCEMPKCIPTHGWLYVCAYTGPYYYNNRDVMDKMNDTRSRWNFHFVSFLFAAHLFIHSVIRSKHCTVQSTQRLCSS